MAPGAGPQGELKSVAKALGADCDACPYRLQPYVRHVGPAQAALGFIGERPGRDEGEEGKPFIGQMGRIADSLWKGVGLARSELFLDNAISCYPGHGKPRPADLALAEACCRPRAEAVRSRVKRLVPMGTMALRSLGSSDNISDVNSVPYLLPSGVEVFPVYHPAVALPTHEPSMIIVLREQWRRLYEWATTGKFPLWELPPVITNLTHSEDTVAEALCELETPEPIGLDVETPMLDVPLDWDTKGRVLYNVGFARARDKLAVCVDWQTASRDLLDLSLRVVQGRTPKVMQNGVFDSRVFLLAEGVKVGDFAFDTRDAFRLIFPNLPSGLDAISAFLTRFPRWKDEWRTRAKHSTRKLHQQNPGSAWWMLAVDGGESIERLRERALAGEDGQRASADIHHASEGSRRAGAGPPLPQPRVCQPRTFGASHPGGEPSPRGRAADVPVDAPSDSGDEGRGVVGAEDRPSPGGGRVHSNRVPSRKEASEDYFAGSDALARATYCGHDSYVQAFLGREMMKKMGWAA
jgi:uracil-DNA glycosylase family 4